MYKLWRRIDTIKYKTWKEMLHSNCEIVADRGREEGNSPRERDN